MFKKYLIFIINLFNKDKFYYYKTTKYFKERKC